MSEGLKIQKHNN